MTRTAFLLPIFALVGACSSSSTPSGTEGLDPTVDPSTADQRENNPDGLAYPTKGLGVDARKSLTSATPGNVIRNYKFRGYLNNNDFNMATSVDTKELSTIALADYYDPENKRAKLLQVIVSSGWCGPCKAETDALVGEAAALAKKGVIIVQVMNDGGVVGKPAIRSDLDHWVADHKNVFPTGLDPSGQQLGPIFKEGAVPYNAIIDVRTMEILYAKAGGLQASDLDTFINWVDTKPASTF